MTRLSRRSLALGAAALFAGCQRRSEAAPTSDHAAAPPDPVKRGDTRLVEWTFEGAVSPSTAVLIPADADRPDAAARYPVLVALHGRGEARKPPREGSLGWPHDYSLGRAIERVSAPPLRSSDFGGFVDAARLQHLNTSLGRHPFGGLIVVCPYVPDLELADDAALAAFGQFLTGVLLPRVRAETPALPGPAATGIDGVSLGGAVALAVGLGNAASFAAVGSLQPALDVHDTELWTARARGARLANPTVALRLLTSSGDYFRDAVRATSTAWTAAGIVHDFDDVLGPHDYPFNRGPGAIEMLLWHDRALRSAAVRAGR